MATTTAVLSVRLPRGTATALSSVSAISGKDRATIVQEALELWFQRYSMAIADWEARTVQWNARLQELVRYGMNVEEATRALSLVKNDQGWLNILVAQKRRAGVSLDDLTGKERAALDAMRVPQGTVR